MNCPRCKAQLFGEIIDELTVEFEVMKCWSCEGMWFSQKNDIAQIGKITEPLLMEFRHIPHKEVQMQPLLCPSCVTPVYMQKLENSRDKKVVMDVCPNCSGVWLDKGELEAIQKEGLASVMLRLFKWIKS
jgi:uncharacterized protein